MVTSHLHTSKMEPVHTVLILMLATLGATKSFLPGVTESLITMRGRYKAFVLELTLYRTCDSVLCGAYCAYLIVPRKSSILTPHGALSSVRLQYPQNVWGLPESLLTTCSSSIDLFPSLFKEDMRKYPDSNSRLL